PAPRTMTDDPRTKRMLAVGLWCRGMAEESASDDDVAILGTCLPEGPARPARQVGIGVIPKVAIGVDALHRPVHEVARENRFLATGTNPNRDMARRVAGRRFQTHF